MFKFKKLTEFVKQNLNSIKHQKEIFNFHKELHHHIQSIRFYQFYFNHHQTCTINQQYQQRNHYREYFFSIYENIINRHYQQYNLHNHQFNNQNNYQYYTGGGCGGHSNYYNNTNNNTNNNNNNYNNNSNSSNNNNNNNNSNKSYDFFYQHNNFHNQSRHKYYHHHRQFYGHYYRRYYQQHHCNRQQYQQQQQQQYQKYQERFGLSSCDKNGSKGNNKSNNNNTSYKFCIATAICDKIYECIQNPILYYIVNKKKIGHKRSHNYHKSKYCKKLPKNHSSHVNNNNNNNNNNNLYSLNNNNSSNNIYVYNSPPQSVTPLTSNKYTMSNYILSQKITLKRGGNSDHNRFFSNSTPQLFVLSKLTRILVPIAMTGVRSSLSKHNIIKRLGMILLILASTTGSYLFLNQDEAPITGRSRLVSYSKEEEHELGKMGYDEMTKEYSAYFLPENNLVQNRVREIAKRIIDVTGRKDLEWECHVVNSETVNACVLPNGKIFVFSGLFSICENEDELASVLSHEIGHAVARHAAERLSISKLGYIFLTLTRGLIGETITGNLTTLFSTNLLNLRYSRIQEIEADLIGLDFMTKANYNPYAALSVQKKLQQYENTIKESSSSSTLDFLSTHPAPDERINKIENWLNENSSKFSTQFNNKIIDENNKLNNINNNNNNNNNVNQSSTRLSYLKQK